MVAIPTAGGLAPLYGFHASMLSAYAILIGDGSYWLKAFIVRRNMGCRIRFNSLAHKTAHK
jgi:hypothetical protein